MVARLSPRALDQTVWGRGLGNLCLVGRYQIAAACSSRCCCLGSCVGAPLSSGKQVAQLRVIFSVSFI